MAEIETPAAPEPQPATAAPEPATPSTRSEAKDTALFLIKLVVIVILFRSFIIAPFSIPSQSMLPRLFVGDYLFVSKWSYGYSRYSLPWGAPLIPGRLFGSTPKRGDVVVFKEPPENSTDVIKRVIGIPGDTVQMRHGQLVLNGQAIPKERVADFTIPISPNYQGDECPAQFLDQADGKPICRYAQFRETLPGGKSYMVLDRGDTMQDDTQVYAVPEGQVFLMGDNRDDSSDSRFEAQGFGFVPMANIQGRAMVSTFSTDGSANWFLPWTWFTAARWSRIGEGF